MREGHQLGGHCPNSMLKVERNCWRNVRPPVETIKGRWRGRLRFKAPVARRRLNMLHRFSLANLAAVLVVLAFSAVQQVPAAAVERDDLRNFAPTATVTVLSTSLLPGATTTTLLTQSACGIISDGAAITTCRRKRQFWVEFPILIAQDAETASYLYQQFQPSPVFA